MKHYSVPLVIRKMQTESIDKTLQHTYYNEELQKYPVLVQMDS